MTTRRLPADPALRRQPAAATPGRDRGRPREEPPTKASRTAAMVGAGRGRAEGRVFQADSARRSGRGGSDPPLPLPEPEKAAGRAQEGRLHASAVALLDAPKTERKIDERELMEGARLLEDKSREFSSRDRSSRSTRARSSPLTSSSRTPA
jgi:hypothetical protein